MSRTIVPGGPFDPSDPLDALAESYRRKVLGMALKGPIDPRFKKMTGQDQFAALAAGVSAGLVCVAFAQVREEGRDEMMDHLIECLKYGRVQAEGILDEAPASEGKTDG